MNTKNNDVALRKKLESAIKRGDMENVNKLLENIPDIEPDTDIESFKKKIKSTREVNIMKKKIYFRIAAVAAVVAAMGVSVGAAAIIKQYSFFKDGNYVTVSSNEDIGEEEAERLAEDTVNNTPLPDETNTAVNEEFSSVNEAEKAYDMDVVMPQKMPDMELSDVQGTRLYAGEGGSVSTIWLTYGDYESKAFGLTVTRNNMESDKSSTYVSSAEAESKGENFVSEKGYTFARLSDTDDEGDKTAYIYMCNIGQYEYSLVFYGFDKGEMESVVNSVDLGEYDINK